MVTSRAWNISTSPEVNWYREVICLSFEKASALLSLLCPAVIAEMRNLNKLPPFAQRSSSDERQRGGRTEILNKQIVFFWKCRTDLNLWRDQSNMLLIKAEFQGFPPSDREPGSLGFTLNLYDLSVLRPHFLKSILYSPKRTRVTEVGSWKAR